MCGKGGGEMGLGSYLRDVLVQRSRDSLDHVTVSRQTVKEANSGPGLDTGPMKQNDLLTRLYVINSRHSLKATRLYMFGRISDFMMKR